MMDAGQARPRYTNGQHEPQSFYELEMRALQSDLFAMHRDMQNELRRVKANGEAAYEAQKKSYETQILALREQYESDTRKFKAEEDDALLHFQTQHQRLDAQNAKEIASLRRRMPRPVRPKDPAPPRRPHCRDTTQVCIPKVKKETLLIAKAMLAWLVRVGVQAQHARGEAFLDALTNLAMPAQFGPMTHASRLLLHAELSAVPAYRWNTLEVTVGKILEARETGPMAHQPTSWMQRAWSSLIRRVIGQPFQKGERLT